MIELTTKDGRIIVMDARFVHEGTCHLTADETIIALLNQHVPQAEFLQGPWLVPASRR